MNSFIEGKKESWEGNGKQSIQAFSLVDLWPFSLADISLPRNKESIFFLLSFIRYWSQGVRAPFWSSESLKFSFLFINLQSSKISLENQRFITKFSFCSKPMPNYAVTWQFYYRVDKFKVIMDKHLWLYSKMFFVLCSEMYFTNYCHQFQRILFYSSSYTAEPKKDWRMKSDLIKLP